MALIPFLVFKKDSSWKRLFTYVLPS